MIAISGTTDTRGAPNTPTSLRLIDLTEFRTWLDREERDGATVIRIEQLREFFRLADS